MSSSRPIRLLRTLLAGCGMAAAQANYNLPLDRPFTLRSRAPLALESEFHRQASGAGPMSYLLPRPCVSLVDSSRVCGSAHGFAYADSTGRRLNLSPGAGLESRFAGGWANVLEMGGLLTGGSGPVSFYLDARMFTEMHAEESHASYDREPVELQDEEASGTVAYSSYSRYRANVSYDLPWGRFSAGRDAAHWGPALHGSLVFHQSAVPFNQAGFTGRIGPLAVHTLYGELLPEGDRSLVTSPASRTLYAHRYEWSVTDDLLLGASEQLIVSGRGEPFALLPVVPLFIFKGDSWERVNNGNIAFDVCYRVRGLGRLYSEFLIDDLQSPTSLFDDQWGNKWGWTAGLHALGPGRFAKAGLILEYSRIEPWVYTHYLPSTAQSANLGYPLGSPLGPDSQSLLASLYAFPSDRWSLAYDAGLIWKGTAPGSGISDTPAASRDDKVFLAGSGGPEGYHSLRGHLRFGKCGVEGYMRVHGALTGSGRAYFAF